MILSRVSDYLRQHGRASVADMALGLGASPDALKAMLAVLERKGRIRRLSLCSTCKRGCCACDPNSLELYEWMADRAG